VAPLKARPYTRAEWVRACRDGDIDIWTLVANIYRTEEEIMSKLTEAFHRSSHKDAVMTAIKLVDDKMMDYTNEHKLEAALTIVRAIDAALPINRMFEGIEVAFLAGAISFAASWIHERVAPYEPGYVPPQPPPKPVPNPPPPLPPVPVVPPIVPPVEVPPPVPNPIPTPAPSPEPVAPYNTNFDLPVPGYTKLKEMGFKPGDKVYVSAEFSKWEVTKPGEESNPGFTPVDTIA